MVAIHRLKVQIDFARRFPNGRVDRLKVSVNGTAPTATD